MVRGRKEIRLNRSVSLSLKIQYKSKWQRIARALLKKRTENFLHHMSRPVIVLETAMCGGKEGQVDSSAHTYTHTHIQIPNRQM